MNDYLTVYEISPIIRFHQHNTVSQVTIIILPFQCFKSSVNVKESSETSDWILLSNKFPCSAIYEAYPQMYQPFSKQPGPFADDVQAGYPTEAHRHTPASSPGWFRGDAGRGTDGHVQQHPDLGEQLFVNGSSRLPMRRSGCARTPISGGGWRLRAQDLPRRLVVFGLWRHGREQWWVSLGLTINYGWKVTTYLVTFFTFSEYSLSIVWSLYWCNRVIAKHNEYYTLGISIINWLVTNGTVSLKIYSLVFYLYFLCS